MLVTDRRRFLIGGSALGVGTLAAPAVWGQSSRPTLRIGANDIRPNLEPINAISNVGPRIVNTMFDTLIRRDFFADGAPGNGTALKPGLAESWTRENDRSVVVRLRPNVLFHNGDKLTAHDVAYTFSEERLWGDNAVKLIPFGRLQSPNWDEPQVIDDLTVRLRTKTPSFLIEKYLASWVGWIVPKAYYSKLGPDGFGLKPVGTGPYKFVEIRAGDRVVVEANDQYWGDKPTASQIIFQAVPERAARVAGLLSGEYDIVTTLTPNEINVINARRNVEARGTLIENFHMFAFNMKQAPGNNKMFRKGLALAVDRPLINGTVWQGLAELPRGFNFPHYGPTYDPNRPYFQHDPKKAAELIKQSGFDGKPITASANNYYANNTDALLMIIEAWKSIGVPARMLDITGGTNPPLEQIEMRAWSNGMALPDALTTIVSEFGPGGAAQTFYGWKAPERFDDLAKQVKEMPEGQPRLAAFNEMRDIFEDEMPAIPLYRPYDVYGVRKNISWKPVSFETMELRASNLKFS